MSYAAAEAPVCEITLDALLACLEKYPKKKPVFKSFCKDYGIAELDELTEALALEILEVIDSGTYVRTKRAKEAYIIEQQKIKLREAVGRYLEDAHEDFITLDKIEDCWLLAKRVNLIVYNINENSVFQPYETSKNNEYFIVCVIKTAEEFVPSDMIGRFISRGCKAVRIYEVSDIKRKLNAIK